ncbi:MAG: diadenylate cyclase CdaA [Chloroflexota bacterium]
MQALQWTLSRLNVASFVDIILVTLILFWLLMLVRGTRADQVLRGALLLMALAAFAAAELRLTVLDWLVQRSFPALLVAIPVIFQPELRRALEQIGRGSQLINRPLASLNASLADHTVDEIREACERLSRHRYGGLIAIERMTGLQDYAGTGVRIDGSVSVDLLVSIFFRNSALHDGAVIVQGDRVAAAACVLPLSENVPEGAGLGTRHRAALGLSEVTDAVIVVVSEETGTISLATNGRLIKGLSGERLRRVLTAFHSPSSGEPVPSRLARQQKEALP